MYSILHKIVSFTVAILWLVACQKDVEELVVIKPEEVTITINADIDNTRTYIEDESIGIIRWSENDQLKVIENTTSYNNTSEISIDENGKAQFTVAFTANDSATSYTYNAVFPASSVIEDSKINIEKIKIFVNDVQNSTETSFDPQADILIAKQIVVDSQPLELNMQFKRLVSIGKITLKNLPVDHKIHQVVFTAGDEDILAGRNYVNAVIGEVTRYGYNNSTNTITVNYSTPIATRDIYFTCNPFEMEEDEVFTVAVVCDGTTYTREVSIPNGRSLVFTEGNMSVFSVDMSDATKEDNELSAEFNAPIIQWDMTKNAVIEEMENFELLHSDDTTLVYKGTGIEDIIAYSFANDILEASIAYVPKDKITIADIKLLFEEYVNIDEYDGYFNSEMSTFAKISFVEDYYCVGWAVCEKEKIGSANNKIWYTNGSTTEATIPYATNNFGANIISNEYDSDNECWVITFDGAVTTIGASAFNGCSSLATITIPDSVTTIGYSAFEGCSSLITITIPNNVTTIEGDAFNGCSSLKSITIPDNVTSIGEYTFSGCSSLTSITIPDSVTSIGRYAFSGCSSITSITIPDNVTSIGNYAFTKCSCLTNVTFGDGVTSIGTCAFENCKSLTCVTIPDSVITIGVGCFSGCTSIAEFNGKYASDGGRSLIINNSLIAFAPVGINEYTIPNNVTEIGYRTFYNCDELINITIPESVGQIGNYVFEDSSKLQNVYCRGIIPPAGGYDMFKNVYGFNIYVYEESISAYKSAPRWKDYASKFVSNGNIPNSSVTTIYYTTTNGKIINIKLPIVSNSYNNGIGEMVVYGELTYISNGVFTDCTTLTSVTIPESVRIINYLAFSGCSSLASVTIPDSVTHFGESAFKGCNKLTSVCYKGDLSAWCKNDFNNASSNPLYYGAKLYINNTAITELNTSSDTTVIKPYAFCGCSNFTSVTIPNIVTGIGEYAFSDCSSLTSITIPDSVAEIGSFAFYNCSNLTSIYISDIAAWCNISFGNESANPLLNRANLYLDNELVADLTIPNNVTTIGKYAFNGYNSLVSITIPDSVTEIGYESFYICKSLTSITIGNSVTSIGKYAFKGCNSLKSVFCKATTPPAGGSDMFYNNASDRKIYVPMESVEAYKSAEYWSSYKSYIVGYNF